MNLGFILEKVSTGEPQTYLDWFMGGFGFTVGVSVTSFILAMLIGVSLAVIRSLPGGKAATFFVSVFRGIPLLNQMFIVYFAIIPLVLSADVAPLTSILICSVSVLSIYMGCRVSEHVYGAITALPTDQREAGKSLGFSTVDTYRLILIPQALKNVFPALTSEFMSTVKNSTVAGSIGLIELFAVSKKVTEFAPVVYEPLIIAGTVYLIINFVLEKLMKKIEKKIFA
ncbi:amino acid ABC transporter permease [Aquitalea pelogenes]|uniref:amino acid ABC transporter permease n=1 Tax=Aquitalea pelogenes TaxID=1293573 RepID=UPI0035B03B73